MSRKCCDLTVSKENGLAETSKRKCALCISPSSATYLLDPLGIPQSKPKTRTEVGGGSLPEDNFSLRDKTKHLTLLFVKVIHGFLLKAHSGVISLNYLWVSDVIPLKWLPGGHGLQFTPNPLWSRSSSTFNHYTSSTRNPLLFFLFFCARHVTPARYQHLGESQ